MEEKGVPKLGLNLSEVRDDSLCTMYFGISCALFALKYLSERQSDDQKCNLLHKLQAAESEIQELKRRRSEDAKANEKVASIYAAQKQSWFIERRKLQREIGGLLNDLRILDKRKNETISELNGKLRAMELSMKSKDKMLEEEEKKRKELEEKLKSMEEILEEVRDKTKREAQDHSSELLKHKTAFIELISNQRQLEAELSRALKQLEASKQQLEFVFEGKEEALLIVRGLSMEIEKMRKDSEQKDEIMSAMMRKSKLDMTEKQMLLKEVKIKKPKRKKSERESTQSWWTIAGSRNERRTLRHLLSRQVSSRLVVDGTKTELRNEHEDNSLHLEHSLTEESTNFDAMGLEEWVHLEAEKYQTANDQRHQVELDAFAEQLQLKDDKLEALRWRLLSTELESKRLKAQIEVVNKDMSQLRHDNLKLEALLLDREEELKTLKDDIAVKLNNFNAQNTNVLQDKKEENEAQSVSSTKAIEEKEVLERDNPTDAFIEVLSPEGLEAKGEEVAAKLIYSSKKEKPVGKMDLHALGVSYKIKRLNQQLLMLERLSGRQGSVEVKGKDELGTKMKGFLLLLSLLSKQVSRYQSLQEKIDGLSQRMSEKDLCGTQIVSSSKRTKEDTKALEHFLEETFQLQRFIVATGQKLMEIHPKIAPEFVGISEELDVSASFDMKRFADTIQTLFKDVQRGLEVRIARIIGDLGGTLTCDGIHSQK